LPEGGGAVRSGAFDGGPLAIAAPRDRELCAQAAGGRHAFAADRDTVLAICEAAKDITLDELRIELAQLGLTVSNDTLNCFFVRHGITRKRLVTRSSRTARTS
jgi:hypothetical protein